MYCQKCGAELTDNMKFCRMCGTPVSQTSKKTSTLSFIRLRLRTIVYAVIVLIIVILVATFGGEFRAIQNLKHITFDDYSTTVTIGDAVEHGLSNPDWEAEKIQDNSYRVSVSGVSEDLYARVVLNFSVNYADDMVYGSLDSVDVNGEHFTDVLSTGLVLSSIYSTS